MESNKEKVQCPWAGSILDYMSPSRGDCDLKKSYPLHSKFRLEKETA